MVFLSRGILVTGEIPSKCAEFLEMKEEAFMFLTWYLCEQALGGVTVTICVICLVPCNRLHVQPEIL